MLTDRIERDLVEDRHSSESLQAWMDHVAEERQNRPPLWRRFLRSLGTSFIRLGSLLTRRFGSSEDKPQDHSPSRRDRAYN